jgi:hypothetical protein
MGPGKNQEAVWQTLKWFRKKENAGGFPMTRGSPVSPLLDGGSDVAQAEYQKRYGVAPKAFVLTAQHAKRSGWGLQSLVKFQDIDDESSKLYNALLANELSVDAYVTQAAPLYNRMIEESQKILPIKGSTI